MRHRSIGIVARLGTPIVVVSVTILSEISQIANVASIPISIPVAVGRGSPVHDCALFVRALDRHETASVFPSHTAGKISH
ncbi:MAG: hypothetical protein OXG08_04215 [Gammaproteobacteria bacterium]|nr:hypothetical protein [Gammaproteobacteria bacterium]